MLIGPPKTGSTAVQQSFRAARAALELEVSVKDPGRVAAMHLDTIVTQVDVDAFGGSGLFPPNPPIADGDYGVGLVRLTGFGQANDFMPVEKRDPTAFAGSVAAWQRALAMAGTGLDGLDFAEIHDCFTIAELIMYEVMGLTPAGEGRRAIEEGWVYRDGKLPVNLSGGLKAKGHPVGATGVSQHVVTAMQLSGTAGEMQLPGARRAAVHNMGGLAIANYVSVLEAV